MSKHVIYSGLKFGMFLSITVGVIDKIKKRTFCELNFSPPYKELREKYKENA
jgi:hypothetical protein